MAYRWRGVVQGGCVHVVLYHLEFLCVCADCGVRRLFVRRLFVCAAHHASSWINSHLWSCPPDAHACLCFALPRLRKTSGTIDVIGGQTATISRVEGRRRHNQEGNNIQVRRIGCAEKQPLTHISLNEESFMYQSISPQTKLFSHKKKLHICCYPSHLSLPLSTGALVISPLF